MRVLQLGPYPPPHGGVQSNLVAIRNILAQEGIPNSVINITRFRRDDAEEVYYPKNALQLVRLLLVLQYDILHLHLGGNLAPRLLALSLLCCLIPGKKAVLTLHSGGYPSSEEGRNTKPWSLRGFVFRRFDRIIGVNQQLIDLFHRSGVPESRTRLIHPHVLSGPPAVARLPDQLGVFMETHHPVLLTVGLLEPEYDLRLQIDVLHRVLANYSDLGLVIIGAGSLEVELRSYIHSRPYRSHILLCGDVPHAATLRAIADSDALLRTTLYDGDAVSVREALHLGTPVIATDNGMRPEGVHLIPVAHPEELERAITRVLALPSRSPAAREPDESNARAVLELYRELCPE